MKLCSSVIRAGLLRWALVLMAQALVVNAHAATVPPDEVFTQAANAARRVTLLGPTEVTLGDQAELLLPEGLDYVPEPEAGLLLQASGQSADPTMLGLIQPHHSGQWLITVHFDPLGHFKHGPESPDWQDDALLQQLQDSAHHANALRRQQGRSESQVGEWLQCPALDAQTHRLAWGVSLTTRAPAKGQVPGEVQNLSSYTAHVLGRDGALTLRMVGPAATHAFDKERLHTILAGIQFLPGRRYEDFQPALDREAQLPLSALITGEVAPAPSVAAQDTSLSPSTVVDAAPTRWLVPSALTLFGVIAVMTVLGLRRNTVPVGWHSTQAAATGFPSDLT